MVISKQAGRSAGGSLSASLAPVSTQTPYAQLGLLRTSFYWFFHDRKALLDEWERRNTGAHVAACDAYADTIAEAALNIIGAFLDGAGFDGRLDFAMRGWALRDDAITDRVNLADDRRLGAIRAVFARFGFDPAEADVRVRTVYLVQIGDISKQSDETLATRMGRIPAYVKTYAGQPATDREPARFHAAHGYVEGEDADAA